jgi:hypothetical protein
MFGFWLNLWATHELWRKAEHPRIREWVRVVKPWELAIEIGSLVVLLSSFFIPWAITGEFLAGAFGLIAATLVGLLVCIPLLAIWTIRGLPPRGTYWDGQRWQYR